MKESPYFAQAAMMIRAIPAVAEEKCFALKGGTAINLFVRDLPRLSVDIDLTYLPLEARDQALVNVAGALDRIASRLRRSLGARVIEVRDAGVPQTRKLLVQSPSGVIKIEPNPVTRGSVHPATERTLVPAAEALFEQSVSIQTLSLPDLYGGKLCAALDRQHSRDLFDVMVLMEGEGITRDILKAFLVYLISHDRPMHEVLGGNDRELHFEREFQGMSQRPVTAKDLAAIRTRMRRDVLETLTPDEREFLMSIKLGEPKWQLLGVDGASDLPAVQWKLRNVQKMSAGKRKEQSEKLAHVLGLQ